LAENDIIIRNVTDNFQQRAEHRNYITANAAKVKEHGRWIIILDQQR